MFKDNNKTFDQVDLMALLKVSNTFCSQIYHSVVDSNDVFSSGTSMSLCIKNNSQKPINRHYFA